MNRGSCVDKRDGHRAARGMLEKIVECGLIGQNETDVLTESCERSVESAREASWLTMDGWTASVCTQLDQQQTFLSWTHKNGKMARTISKEICSTQSRSSNEQERTSIGC